MAFNKTDSMFTLKWAKKIKAINHLGGKCKRCNTDDIFVLCFHHREEHEKEGNINQMLNNIAWSDVMEEIDKCDVLCQNCHREVHEEISKENRKTKNYKFVNDKRNINKRIMLNWHGSDKCVVCGYNDCLSALSFHHSHEKDKKFILSQVNLCLKSIQDLTTEITDELDKCEVLCQNCHTKEHTKIDKFNTLKSEIYSKIETYTPRPKVNKQLVIELREKGKTYKEIMEITGIPSKGTISYIITNYNRTKK